jgi:ribosomal-protein-alanine N-acetyltransferase
VLKGKTIHLRTARKTDLEALYEIHCNVEIRGPHFPLNFDSESAFLERFGKTGFWGEDQGMLLIVDNKTNRILGQVAFFKPEIYYDAYELGYWLYDKKDRGKGIMTQAVDLFVKYLFDWKNIFRLQIQAQGENEASKRVAEKCGFTHESTARHALIVDGKPADLEVYALTREDFKKQSEA